MKFFYLISLFSLLNFLIFLNFKIIEKKLPIYDKPDRKLKKHKRQTSLLGGTILLLNLYLVIIIFKLLDLNEYIFHSEFISIVLLLSSFFYLVGIVDDLKKLSPIFKLFLICFSLIVVAYLFPEIKLDYIKVSFLNKIYFFNNYSILFLMLSFALLSNAFNMFDGINLQLILFSIFIFFIFIFNGFLNIFFILLSISLFFIGLLNYKNKLFLGDSGCFLLSAIIGCSFIYQYKFNDKAFLGDEVFIILLIPSIDMLRLFLSRLLNRKNPFKGDLNHLHHLVLKLTKNTNLTVLITLMISILPTLLLFLNIKTYFIFVLSLFTYIALISYCKVKLQ